jgi:hypothetical protein
MHLTTSPIDWYAARAAGIVAYVLLSLVVCLGLAMAGKAPTRRWPKFTQEGIHRVGGLMVGTFLAIHIGTIAADSYLPFKPVELIVPLASHYRPIWIGLGICAAELLLALAITNRLRKRLEYKTWRSVHYLNFGVWTAATLHSIGIGTDRSAPWMLAIYAVAVGAVGGLLGWRFGRTLSWRGTAALGGALLGVALPVWLALGPLSYHPKPWNPASFSDRLSGQILSQQAPTKAIVSMAGTANGAQSLLVRADLLLGQTQSEQTALQLEYIPSGLHCTGQIDRVAQTGFSGHCRLSDGSGQRNVKANWQLTGVSSNLVGTLEIKPRGR